MRISVITWDANFREHTHTIDFFAKQEFAQADFEVIWVDFYSSNNRVRQKIEGYPNVRLVTLENPPDTAWHLGRCINAGVKASSGGLLVIPDGDIVVEPDFLYYIWQVHQEIQDLVLYFPRYDEPQQAGSNQSRNSISYLQQHSVLRVATNYAGCLSLRREIFERIKGYETHAAFAGSGINGMETYIRLRNAGMPIKWTPDKKIYHPWHQNTGLPGHNDKEALWHARYQHPWIIPYGGLRQSWIVHCRELSVDKVADETACDRYLGCMPQVDLDDVQNIQRRFTSNVKTVNKNHGMLNSPSDKTQEILQYFVEALGTCQDDKSMILNCVEILKCIEKYNDPYTLSLFYRLFILLADNTVTDEICNQRGERL